MKTLLLLMLLCGAPVIAAASLYSCRDSAGHLHVTDNLQALPDECRPDAKRLEATDPDNLQFVPDRTPQPVVNPRFEKQVLEQERQTRQQQQEAQRMIAEAEELLALYQQAQQDRRQATRRWSYGSRQIIQQATEQIAEAQAGKERLLSELEQQRFSSDVDSRLRTLLDQMNEN